MCVTVQTIKGDLCVNKGSILLFFPVLQTHIKFMWVVKAVKTDHFCEQKVVSL